MDAPLLIYITRTNDLFIIKTNGYQADVVLKIRKISGRVWVIAKLEWTVAGNEATLQLLHELFEGEHVHFETSLRLEEHLIQKWFPYDPGATKVIREYSVKFTNLMTLKGFIEGWEHNNVRRNNCN